MSIRILVKDRADRPFPKRSVFIKWKGGGTTSKTTDDNGFADTGVNSKGTIEYLRIDDKDMGYNNVYIDNGDKVIMFKLNKG